MISEEQPMFFYLALKMNNLLEKIFHPIVRNLNTCASVVVLKIIISNQVPTYTSKFKLCNLRKCSGHMLVCIFSCKNLDAILSIEFYHLDSVQT